MIIEADGVLHAETHAPARALLRMAHGRVLANILRLGAFFGLPIEQSGVVQEEFGTYPSANAFE